MASTVINNTPEELNMVDFKAYADSQGGPAKSCRFAVRIIPQGEYITQYGPIARQLLYMCEAAEYPGRGFNNIDLRYYGPSFKLPYQSSYEDLNLTFICRSRSFEREFFDDWMMYINPPNTFDFNYRDQYRAEIQIFQFTDFASDRSTGNPKAEYMFTLHNAYPILVNPQPLTWADDQFLRLGVTFTYTWWTRKGRDPEPRNLSGANGSFRLTTTEIR
jgi:hypothetical protein